MKKIFSILILLSVSLTATAFDDWDDDDWDDEYTEIFDRSRESLRMSDLSNIPPLVLEKAPGQSNNDVIRADKLLSSVLVMSLHLNNEHNLRSDTGEIQRIKELTPFTKFDLEEGGGGRFSDMNLYMDDIENSKLYKNLHALNERIRTMNNRCSLENKVMKGELPDSAIDENNRIMPLFTEVLEHVGVGTQHHYGLKSVIIGDLNNFGYNNSESSRPYNFCQDNMSFDHLDNLSSRDAHMKTPLYELNTLYCEEFNKLHACTIDYMSRFRNRNTGRTIDTRKRMESLKVLAESLKSVTTVYSESISKVSNLVVKEIIINENTMCNVEAVFCKENDKSCSKASYHLNFMFDNNVVLKESRSSRELSIDNEATHSNLIKIMSSGPMKMDFMSRIKFSNREDVKRTIKAFNTLNRECKL